jgi:hypothetical protein
MPGPNLHLSIAQGLLNRLKGTSYYSKVNRNYLYLGSLAPDIGVYPGCYPLLSNLAHYHLTGSLAQAFLQKATCSNTFSYALGWLTHYYADCLIHPLINRAVGEELYGDDSLEVDYNQSPQDHFLVEVGIDAFFSGDFKGYPAADKSNTLPLFLTDVYKQCYGLKLPLKKVSKSDYLSYRYGKILSEIALIHHSRFYRTRLSGYSRKTFATRYIPGLLLSALRGKEFRYFGIINAFQPKNWLVEEVAKSVQLVLSEVVSTLAEPERALPELNLDNGKSLEQDLSLSVKATIAELNLLRTDY